ncbi:MAG: hypothetical protein BM564_01085 [Bacteroidetes bacterium MedPE-SWsnd-G2]|nr:MAG: hypothetical protein BM564_01085 [Bacteroidetes bacterium MedPE-SWsnd-G2]
MNNTQITGKVNQLKGNAKIWWGKATGDALIELDGNKDKMLGYLQEKKGMLEADAKKEMQKFESAKQALENKIEDVNSGIKAKWDKFTHEDISEINGSLEAFADKLKTKYNNTQEETEAQIKEFMSKF